MNSKKLGTLLAAAALAAISVSTGVRAGGAFPGAAFPDPPAAAWRTGGSAGAPAAASVHRPVLPPPRHLANPRTFHRHYGFPPARTGQDDGRRTDGRTEPAARP